MASGSHWNTAKMFSSHGYVKLRVGRGHPLADPYGYAYEHRVILAAAGIPIPPGYEIHHKNKDKADNRIENLAVLTSREHRAEHHKRHRETCILCSRPWNPLRRALCPACYVRERRRPGFELRYARVNKKHIA